MAPPVSLFPPPPSLGFAIDKAGLQRAVDTALAELQKARTGAIPFSLAIIDLGGGGNTGTLKCGAYKPDQIDYVASSVKVAAMLAAFALRDMVRRFQLNQTVTGIASSVVAAAAAAVAAAQSGKPPKPLPPTRQPALFDALRAAMDPAIDSASPAQLAAVQRTHRIPKYEQVFAKPTGTSPAEFTGAFRESIRLAIVPSDNAGAGRVIRGVGYGYINALMQHFGLYVPKTPAGVWLAGDFVGQYPYVRITSVNDGGVAQAGSALAMAQMLAIIVNKACIDAGSCEEMRRLLAAASKGIDQPFLSREIDPKGATTKVQVPLDKITHAKLGFGPLKKGGNVCSEIIRVEGLMKPGKAYAVAFQNLNENNSSLADVAFMLRRSLELYE